MALMLINLPEMPQWDELDFVSCLSTLESSIGELLMLLKLDVIESVWAKKGTSSWGQFTVALATNKSLSCSLFSFE